LKYSSVNCETIIILRRLHLGRII